MCYSAQIIDGFKQYVRHWGAEISIQELAELYGFSFDDRRKIPRLVDLLFRTRRPKANVRSSG